MVKADAYNHGIECVAEHTEHIVDRFGVATIGECMALRRGGISAPISVFSYDSDSAIEAFRAGATPVIHDFRTLESVRGLYRDNIDIKIDSGMHRFGFDSRESCHEAVRRLKMYDIHPRAICTHFYAPCATEGQFAAFNYIAEELLTAYPDINVHVSASDGIMLGRYADGVRAGRIAYNGAMSVRSNVIALHGVKRGDSVGYCGAYIADKDTRIAVVRGGYYDGILRAYGGADVIVNGRVAKIAGKVCMDVFLVDVGDIPIECGDEVIIIDPQTIDSYIKVSGASVYEVMTSVKGRVQRKYIE